MHRHQPLRRDGRIIAARSRCGRIQARTHRDAAISTSAVTVIGVIFLDLSMMMALSRRHGHVACRRFEPGLGRHADDAYVAPCILVSLFRDDFTRRAASAGIEDGALFHLSMTIDFADADKHFD